MTLQHNSTTIYYTCSGQGRSIVFLHGFLENSSIWDALVAPLSPQYQVVTIDLLGHGKTSCQGDIHTMQDMALLVEKVLSFLKLSPAFFIGHSMGGYVALEFAALFPNMVSGLLLLNSTAKADSEARKHHRDRAIQVVKKNPKAYTSMAITNLFAARNRERFAIPIAKIKEVASKTPARGIIAAQEGMKIRKDHTEILKKLPHRKMMIAGKKDPVLAFNELEKEAQECGLQFYPLDGGHMSHIENFEALLNILQTL